MDLKLPEQKVVELSKQLIHSVRTHVSVDTDSKGKRKPKVTIEIDRETEDGTIENIKKLVFEQLELSKELISEKLNELDLILNTNGG